MREGGRGVAGEEKEEKEEGKEEEEEKEGSYDARFSVSSRRWCACECVNIEKG